MKIYHYHPISKKYMREGTADLSPLDAKNGLTVWLIPANATSIEPPEFSNEKEIVFNEEKKSWEFREV
jgi:hypothetical protein